MNLTKNNFFLISIIFLNLGSSVYSAPLICSNIFATNTLARSLTANAKSEYLVQVNLSQDGHDFKLTQINNDKTIFNVAFKDLDGKKLNAYKQEYLPSEKLSSLERELNQKLIEKFRSVDFYQSNYNYYFENMGALYEYGLDKNFKPLPTGQNPNWRNDQKIVNEIDENVKKIVKNGVEIGYWIIEDYNGNLHSNSDLFTSRDPKAIIFKDSLPSLEKLIDEAYLPRKKIKAIHFYHLHPLGSPLSPADVTNQPPLHTINLNENIELHIYALRMNSDKSQVVGAFHYSRMSSKQ